MLDLLLVGHITQDRLVSASGEERIATGGAVYYGSLPAALLGAQVGVLTKLSSLDGEILEELRDSGVAVQALPSQQTTVIHNIARSDDLERRRFLVESVADPFTPDDLERFGQARIVLVCALMRGEMPLAALAAIGPGSELALDVQGFVRCREGNALSSAAWPEQAEVLRRVTYLKADRREAEILTGLSDVERAMEVLASQGPREVLVTGGRSILLRVGGQLLEAPLDPAELRGRTGRGDTAIASYLARRLLGDAPAPALRYCAAVVSRKLEHEGPYRGPLEEVERSLARPVLVPA